MTHTDHQGADAQCRSCPLVVRALSHGRSSAQLQARMMAASTAVVVGASPASSAALRMSDCSLGLLPAGKWASLEGCRAARGMSDCQLRPNPSGSRPQPASGHPPGVPDCERAQAGLRDLLPLSAQIFVHQASSLYIKG
uniref:Uncharacterized protein n=1 Tax=Myotis myotis TaxID=51298 RepID=A0A7J7Z4R9_MYOMY|nr:hypothetical protein mMyoMyo1_010441 [Myotis myotis]